MKRTCERGRWLVIPGLLLAATAAWGQTKGPGSRPVAVVNDEVISRADFELATKRLPSLEKKSDADQKIMQRELLEVMIDETLFRQCLRKNVAMPETRHVQKRIDDLEKSLRARKRTLADYLLDIGQSEAGLRADIVSVLQWNSFVRKYATEAELRRYYEANREIFDGVLIRASHIAMAVPRSADDKTINAAAKKLQAIRHEIESGMEFADAAKKYSQDERTAAKGGDLGFFPPNQRDSDAFIRVASTMKVGQVSDVVHSEHGCHIIKVTDRKEGKPARYEDAKDAIQALWAEDLKAKVIADQRKAAKIEILLP